MQFDVRIRKLIDNEKPLKAVASVTVDGAILIHGVKVIWKGDEIFVAMPSEAYTDKDGKEVHRTLVHLIGAENRQSLEAAVLTAYRQKLTETN